MIGLLLVCSVAALLVGPPSAHAAFPGDNGKVIFSRQVQAVQFVTRSNYDIFAMNGDGSGQDDLSDNDPGNSDASVNAVYDESHPAVSPDGAKIVFDSNAAPTTTGGRENIWVMNSGGTGQKQLTTGSFSDVDPSFSPNGQKIVFQSNRDLPGGSQIYVMNVDGTGIQRLTDTSSFGFNPAYSPDGTRIAFQSVDSGKSGISLMNADGTGRTRLTPTTVSDGNEPTFSPDGRKIAFTSFRDGNAEIYVMNVDGSGPTRLTNNSSTDGTAAFSPDGTKIAFKSNRDGNDEIYAMNANGTGQTRLTNSTLPDTQPDWGRVAGSATQCSDGVDNDGDGKVDFGPTRDPGCESPADDSENSDAGGPDTVPPDTTLTAGPSGLTSDSTPTFAFQSSETGSTFECRVDAAAFAACSSPHTTASLSDGQHTFEVRAKDAAGNTDLSPASRTFTVDATAPETTITDGPAAMSTTNDDTPTFAFQSSETGSTFECRVDAAAFASCSSPHTTASLSDGQHTFEVRAKDAAGNTDSSPASRTFTVQRSAADTTPPVTTITRGPAGPTNDTTPTFEFESSETGSSFRCRVDGATLVPCSSPYTTTALSEGVHTFEVRATDAAGNTDPTPESREFRVDITPPRTAITEGPAGPTRDPTPTFEFESSEGASTLECRVDEAAFAPCTSPHSTSLLSDGPHTFQVRATDAAGNTDPAGASRTFTVDVVVPDTTIDSGPIGTTSDPTPTFGFSANEAGATFECRIDQTAFGACASPHQTGPLSAGQHTFQVRATDAAGNTDASPATRAFTVAAPAGNLLGSPPLKTDGGNVLGPGSLVAISSQSIAPRRFAAAPTGSSALAAKAKRPKAKPKSYGANVSYRLNMAATVRFTVSQTVRGRKQGKGKNTRCVAQTKKNRKAKPCKRTVTLKGSFVLSGKAGPNSFRFTGRLANKKLKRGSYTLTATPTAQGKTGKPAGVSFTITR